jgi:hypothetical protein
VPGSGGASSRARADTTKGRVSSFEEDRPFVGVGDTGIEPVTSSV